MRQEDVYLHLIVNSFIALNDVIIWNQDEKDWFWYALNRPDKKYFIRKDTFYVIWLIDYCFTLYR